MNNVFPINKLDANYSPREFENIRSNEGWDEESIASDAYSVVFPEPSSLDSNSSLGSLYHTATYYMADTFCKDTELVSLYNTALSKLNLERFMRNRNRLLKKYFVDLGTEIRNDLQRRSVRFLRRSEQRKQITKNILNHITGSRKSLELNQAEPDRKLILERFLQMQE